MVRYHETLGTKFKGHYYRPLRTDSGLQDMLGSVVRANALGHAIATGQVQIRFCSGRKFGSEEHE